jgi:hypothetical protein
MTCAVDCDVVEVVSTCVAVAAVVVYFFGHEKCPFLQASGLIYRGIAAPSLFASTVVEACSFVTVLAPYRWVAGCSLLKFFRT